MSKFKNHHERRKAAIGGSEASSEKTSEQPKLEVAVEESSQPEASTELVGDVNGDGAVDQQDLEQLEEIIEETEDKGEL